MIALCFCVIAEVLQPVSIRICVGGSTRIPGHAFLFRACATGPVNCAVLCRLPVGCYARISSVGFVEWAPVRQRVLVSGAAAAISFIRANYVLNWSHSVEVNQRRFAPGCVFYRCRFVGM